MTVKTIQITLPDDVHQRLRNYAWETKQTMADAARTVFAHCLPPLPGEEPEVTRVEQERGRDAQT